MLLLFFTRRLSFLICNTWVLEIFNLKFIFKFKFNNTHYTSVVEILFVNFFEAEIQAAAAWTPADSSIYLAFRVRMAQYNTAVALGKLGTANSANVNPRTFASPDNYDRIAGHEVLCPCSRCVSRCCGRDEHRDGHLSREAPRAKTPCIIIARNCNYCRGARGLIGDFLFSMF